MFPSLEHHSREKVPMEIEQDTNQTLLTLSEFVNYFLKNEGVLDQSRFMDFWYSMRGASYISILILKYIITLTGEEKHVSLVDVVKRLSAGTLSSLPDTKVIETDQETNQFVQNIAATIYFVSLFFKIDTTFPPFKAAISRLSIFGNRLYQNTGQPEYMFLNEIEGLIQKREDIQYYLQYYCQLNIPKNIDFNHTPSRLLVVPLIETYIRSHFDTKESSLNIFENLIHILMDPLISDHDAFTAMNMMRIYLMYSPYPPVSLLQKIIDCIKRFVVWPKIYSNIAMNILNLATIEQKTPGAGLRSKLIEEIPLLMPSSHFSEISSSMGYDKRVILIFDKDFKNSVHLSELLKSHSPQQLTGSEIQLSMLSSIFESCLFIKSDLLGLEYCDPESIDTFYNEAMKILEICVTLSNSDAMQYRIQHLTELKERMTSSITSVRHFKKINKLSLPPLDFSFREGSFEITQSTSKEYTSFSRHHYPKTESYRILSEILKDYYSKSDIQDRPLVKIGIVGGDSTIHNIVSGVVYLKLSNPEYFEKLDIRFYYIPVTSSSLGSWISSEDEWYYKQVNLLTRCLLGIYPTTSNKIPSKESDYIPPMLKNVNTKRDIQSLSMLVNNNDSHNRDKPNDQYLDENAIVFNPSSVLRSGIENYFREARWPVNINIWKCECFTEHSTFTIPFFSRAQIGLKASVESFKKSNNLPENLKDSEVISSKNFKFSSLTTTLKFIQTTPSSVARVTGTLESRTIKSIEVASLPIQDDKLNYMNPNPTRPWLELMVVEEGQSKSKKKGTREEPKCYHISQLEIVSEEKFDILLDKVIYGPFKKVKITSTIQPDKEKMISIPIMTFYENENDL